MSIFNRQNSNLHISAGLCRGIAFCLLVLFVNSGSFAHTGLKSSYPGDGDAINVTPEHVHLIFTAAVALVRFDISLHGARELDIDFTPSTEAKAEFMLPMPILASGRYEVNWAVIGEDGHTVNNSFSFTYDPDAPASADHHNDESGPQAHAH